MTTTRSGRRRRDGRRKGNGPHAGSRSGRTHATLQSRSPSFVTLASYPLTLNYTQELVGIHGTPFKPAEVVLLTKKKRRHDDQDEWVTGHWYEARAASCSGFAEPSQPTCRRTDATTECCCGEAHLSALVYSARRAVDACTDPIATTATAGAAASLSPRRARTDALLSTTRRSQLEVAAGFPSAVTAACGVR
jgi:hypothetical protein